MPGKCPECGAAVQYLVFLGQEISRKRAVLWAAGAVGGIGAAVLVSIFGCLRYLNWFILSDKHSLLVVPFTVLFALFVMDLAFFYKHSRIGISLKKWTFLFAVSSFVIAAMVACWCLVLIAECSFFAI
ncbi:MAG: hypothetical protein QM783_05070 [Phycisphaerales bacterium]